MARYTIVCIAACLLSMIITISAAPGHAESYQEFHLDSHGGWGGAGGSGGGWGGEGGSGGDDGHHHHGHHKYHFKYGVHDGHTHDIKDQKEEGDHGHVVGEYSLLQPDGRKRIVHYHADKHGGFHAHVTYSGHAIHPYHHHH